MVCSNCNTGKKSKIYLKDNFNLYFCNICKNGFVYPVPKNIAKYYPKTYLQFPGALARAREALHYFLQVRRRNWLTKHLTKGEILDVGAGEGVFGKALGNNFKVTNIDAPFTQTKNKEVLKIDFLKWKTKKKFDGIVFLESLEHVPKPQDYLKKASSMTKKGGYILIECPRFGSIESRILGKYWLHLDLPRHLAHLTEEGIIILANRCGLTKVSQEGVLIYEFSAYGLLVSLMLILKIKTFNLKEKSLRNLLSLVFVILLLPLAFLLETFLYLINQAPIGLTILRKNN